jgi:hypothetical protein
MICTLVVIGAGYAHVIAVGRWLFICLYVRALAIPSLKIVLAQLLCATDLSLTACVRAAHAGADFLLCKLW